MANILDYIRWRGDLTFSQDPPNPVDALIFSALTYIHYGGKAQSAPTQAIALKDAAEDFFSQENLQNRVRVKTDLTLLRLAAQSVRFGASRLCMYRDVFIPEQETQFAAMTFLLDDGSALLAFRGTDNTLVGWKEDFNMTFQQTIPAQQLAVAYTREVSQEYVLPLRLAGHSKGGNLAVFAAARSSPMVQQRIMQVYNQDGPGFTDYLMDDPGYLAMVPRIRTYVPQSSVIGMLLEHAESYTVVRSKSLGLMQHDPYSWEVMGCGFCTAREVSEGSQLLDATMKTWFSQMTSQERNELVDLMFALLGSANVETAVDIFQPRNIRTYLKTIRSDEKLRQVLSTEFLGFVEAARKARAKMESERKAEALLEEGFAPEE